MSQSTDSSVRRRRWRRGRRVRAYQSVAVVALTAGVVAVASRTTGAPPATARNDDIVRDGDRVAGQGFILALPGRPVQLCGPLGGIPRAAPEAQPRADEQKVPEPCRNALMVTGIRLDQLTDRHAVGGAVWGWARVEGVYRSRTLIVTRQDAYVSARRPASAADPVPCPEPAGGWPRQDDLVAAVGRLDRVVRQHGGELNGPYVTYPYGWHLQDTSNGKGIEVYVVTTTGDVAAARRLLHAVFPSQHLCVRQATWSAAQMDAAVHELQTSAEAIRLNVAAGEKDVLNDRVTADVLIVDQAVAGYLAKVAGGRIVPVPVLHKVT